MLLILLCTLQQCKVNPDLAVPCAPDWHAAMDLSSHIPYEYISTSDTEAADYWVYTQMPQTQQ